MEKVPGTGKTPLEKVQAELQEEIDLWNELGMSLNNTTHPPASLYAIKMQVQTLINLLIEKNFFTNEEFNIEFKTLILNDMRRLREFHEPQIREERRQAILGGGKPDITIPNLRIIGPDGKGTIDGRP